MQSDDLLSVARRFRLLRSVTLGVVFCLFLASCGGGDGSDAEADELARLIGEGIWANAQADIARGEAPPIEYTRADSDCVARAIVEEAGLEALADAGITVEAARTDPNFIDNSDAPSLDSATQSRVFDAIDGCIDFGEVLSGVFSAAYDISEASAECLTSGLLDEESARSAVVSSFFGGGASDAKVDMIILDLLGECLTDEELER
jgi:hypothetical protein